MEHPYVNIDEIVKEQDLSDIQAKITQLYTQLNYYYSTGNSMAINQIQMLIETYQEAQARKLELLAPDSKKLFDDKIRITK